MKFLNKIKDENLWKLISMICSVTAIVVGIGPYIFEGMYEWVIANVSETVKYCVTGGFIVANAIVLYFGKDIRWKHASVVASFIMASFWMAEPIKVFMVSLTEKMWVKGIALGFVAVSLIISFTVHVLDRRRAK